MNDRYKPSSIFLNVVLLPVILHNCIYCSYSYDESLSRCMYLLYKNGNNIVMLIGTFFILYLGVPIRFLFNDEDSKECYEYNTFADRFNKRSYYKK